MKKTNAIEQYEDGELVTLCIHGRPVHVVRFSRSQVRADFGKNGTYYWGGLDYDLDDIHKTTKQDAEQIRADVVAKFNKRLAVLDDLIEQLAEK